MCEEILQNHFSQTRSEWEEDLTAAVAGAAAGAPDASVVEAARGLPQEIARALQDVGSVVRAVFTCLEQP